MRHVGHTLKKFIEDRNLQKNLIANEAGITPTYLSRIFEKDSIDCELLDKLCKAIKMDPSYIFNDNAPQSLNSMSNITAEATFGSVVNITQGEVESLRALLQEKERTIQILIQAKGFQSGTESEHGI